MFTGALYQFLIVRKTSLTGFSRTQFLTAVLIGTKSQKVRELLMY